MKQVFLLLSFAIFMFSCGGETKKAENTTPVVAQSATQYVAENLPSIDVKILERLFKEATAVDYIFHNHPFSMSQDEDASIKTSITYFSGERPQGIPVNCKPVARQSYQINGEFVAEFDVYFDQNCTFFAHMVNEKPVAANKMTEAGLAFFNQVISQAIGQSQQLRGN